MSKKLIYSGETSEVIEDPNNSFYVYKVAKPDYESYFLNERMALNILKNAGITKGIVLVDEIKAKDRQGRDAIRMWNFHPNGQRLDEYILSQEKMQLDDNITKEGIMHTLTNVLQERKEDITEEKLMTRVAIFLDILDISGSYIRLMSQNDINPANIIVYGDDVEKVEMFDFNCAVHYDKKKNIIKHFVEATNPAKAYDTDYKYLDGIRVNTKWAHPELKGKVNKLLEEKKANAEDILRHSEFYQAANVLYWSLTGKRLEEYERLEKILPDKYKVITQDLDKLVGAALKELGAYNQKDIDKILKELRQKVQDYKLKIKQEKDAKATVMIQPGESGLVERLQKERQRLEKLPILYQLKKPPSEQVGCIEKEIGDMINTLKAYQGRQEKIVAQQQLNTFMKYGLSLGIIFWAGITLSLCVGVYIFPKIKNKIIQLMSQTEKIGGEEAHETVDTKTTIIVQYCEEKYKKNGRKDSIEKYINECSKEIIRKAQELDGYKEKYNGLEKEYKQAQEQLSKGIEDEAELDLKYKEGQLKSAMQIAAYSLDMINSGEHSFAYAHIKTFCRAVELYNKNKGDITDWQLEVKGANNETKMVQGSDLIKAAKKLGCTL